MRGLLGVLLIIAVAAPSLACKGQAGFPKPARITELLAKQETEKLSVQQLKTLDEWKKDGAKYTEISKQLWPVCAIKDEDANTCFDACSKLDAEALKNAPYVYGGVRYFVPESAVAQLEKDRRAIRKKWEYWYSEDLT